MLVSDTSQTFILPFLDRSPISLYEDNKTSAGYIVHLSMYTGCIVNEKGSNICPVDYHASTGATIRLQQQFI